jgi:hypothetical protein
VEVAYLNSIVESAKVYYGVLFDQKRMKIDPRGIALLRRRKR